MRSGMNRKMARKKPGYIIPGASFFHGDLRKCRVERGQRQIGSRGPVSPRKWDVSKRLVLCVCFCNPRHLGRSLTTTLVSSRPVWHFVSKRKKERRKKK